MKQLKILGLLVLIAIGFNACQQDDDVVFVAGDSNVTFTNSFLSEYILTPAASGNIGERFTWNTPDVGVQTNFTYSLEKSINGDFSDAEVVGTTSANEIAVTIGDLLVYASQAGLDADAATEAPNTGQVSFRVVANLGEGGESTTSPAQALTLVLPEQDDEPTAVCDLDQLYGVGAGLPDAGWSWDNPVVIPCTGNGVYSANVNFTSDGDANFRFFTVETDWGSGQNYPFYADAGYTIDANFENAMDGDSNFKFVGTSGLYYLTIDTINKEITLGPPQATGTCEFDQLYGVGAGLTNAGWSWDTPEQILCSSDGVYSATVALQNNGGADNNFRFFTVETDWASGRNYPWYADNGYTIDPLLIDAMDGDNNFAFIGTSGTFLLTIDDNNKTITLSE